MKWDQLKQAIGQQAKDIIEADRCDGSGKLICWMTAHASSPELDWSSDALHYRCHNCALMWDIIDHAKDQANDDMAKANEILHEWAGVPVDDKDQAIIPATPKAIEWEGIEPVSRDRSKPMVRYLMQRGISEATIKRYHVTGDSEAIYFNYVCGKTLVKIKGRLIGDHANGRDKYSPTPKGGTNTLYGQHTRSKQGVLVICEGEVDALSAFEAVLSRGEDKTISVSSVPSGSSSFSWLENSMEYIQQHQIVIVVPDNDAAGEKFKHKMQSELSMHVRVATADLSKYKVNDANQLLQEHGKDVLYQCIIEAEEYKPDCTVDFSRLKTSERPKYSISGFWSLDRITYGFQHGMVTLFTGRSGDGKTTILRQIIATNIEAGCRVGAVMGEEGAKQFRERYVFQAYPERKELVDPWIDEWGNHRKEITQQAVDLFEREISPRLSVFSNEKLGDPETLKLLFGWIKREATLFGTKLFILDNLMKLESGSDGQLLEAQRIISNTLKVYAEKFACHIILVAHPRKDTEIVTVDSISGSKNLSNIVDTVIIFQRYDNLNESVARPLIEKRFDVLDYGLITASMQVGKNRENGWLGSVAMRYNQETGTIHDLSTRGTTNGRWTIPAREMEDSDTY